MISKWKNIFRIVFCISGNYIKFGILWKKRWASEGISFWNCRVEMLGLLTCLKRFGLEHLWTVNMLKGLKDCLNMHASIFFDNCWLLWKKIGSKSSNLVVSENLSLFVNILRSDEKHSLSIKASEVFFIFTQTT